MVRALIRALIATGLFAVLIGAAIGWWWYSENANSGTLPNGIAYTKHTMETTRPLTVDEARKHWKGRVRKFKPTNVYIGAYHEWQAVVEVVRFEAPVEDCLATAQAILQAHNAANPRLRW